jgi:hypothetical protein
MKLPTPDDPVEAPVWDNYVVAQAVQASLGLIPRTALAFGVAVQGADVRLVFQLSELREQDKNDMHEIWHQLETLVGDAVNVDLRHEVRQLRHVSPLDGVRWVFLARTPDDET